MVPKEFHDNIWWYYNVFTFRSMGVNQVRTLGSCFHVPERLTKHKCSALIHEPNKQPILMQLYVYDMNETLQAQIWGNSKVHPNTILTLRLLLQYKPFVIMKTRLWNLTWGIRKRAMIIYISTWKRCLMIYNLPQNNEIAKILPINEEFPNARHDIMIYLWGGALHCTSKYYTSSLLHYIFFSLMLN
jgi:hypothetical protein